MILLIFINPFSTVLSDDNNQSQNVIETPSEISSKINDNRSSDVQEISLDEQTVKSFDYKISPLEQEIILNIQHNVQAESKPAAILEKTSTSPIIVTPPASNPETLTQESTSNLQDVMPSKPNIEPLVEDNLTNNPKVIQSENMDKPLIPTPMIEDTPSNVETSTPVQDNTLPVTQEITYKVPGVDQDEDIPSKKTNAPIFSIQDAIVLAIQNNPDIDMALERSKRAGFSVQEAKAKYYPTLEFKTQSGWRYLNPYPGNENGEGDHSTEASATLLLKQLVFDGFASISEVKRNEQIENTTKIENEIIIEEITSETITHYFKILQFQETTREATLFEEAMELIMEKITVMQEVGAASMIELDFSKARLASAKSASINAKSSLKDAISNLEFLVGPLNKFRTILPYDLEMLKLKSLEHYLKSSQNNNSQVRLNKSIQKSTRFKIKSAKGKFYPTVNFVIEGKHGYNEFGGQGSKSDSSVLLQANYLIYDAGKRQAGLSKANSKHREQEILSRQFQRELIKGIKLDYNQVSSIKQTLVTIDEEISANTKLQSLNRKNLELGDIKIIELIEVEERLYNSKANKHLKLSDFYVNYYNLMTKSGLIKDAVIPLSTKN